MRSLPERFAYRIAAIEEVRDVDTLKLDELMGKLLAQELNHGENHREKSREKKIAFQAETSYATPQNSSTQEDEQTVEESLALLSKNFGKFLKKIEKRGNLPSTGKPVNFQNSRRNSNQDNSEESKPRRIQCRECEGFGHIQSECANTLKKKKKMSLTTGWSDEEESDDDQGNNNQVTNFVAFSSKVPLDSSESTVASTVATDCETESRYENMCSDYDKNLNENSYFAEDPNSSSDEEEPTLDEVNEVYEKMYQKWLDVVKVNNFLEKEKFVLVEENKTLKVRISTLEERVISSDQEKNSLQGKLTQTQEAIAKLNLGRGNLDEILSNNKPNYNRLGIGGSQLPKADLKQKEDQNRKINFVKQASVSQTVATVEATKHDSKKKFIPTCFFCQKLGHIRPRCFKYLKLVKKLVARSLYSARADYFPSPSQKPKNKIDISNRPQQKIWVEKSTSKCLSAITSLKASTTNDWYFDSGCSRHMTGVKEFLKNYQQITGGAVTFGNGKKGEVLGKGSLNHENLPKLKNVLLVEGLTSNLISISQLCDQDLEVRFNKFACRVLDKDENCVIQGTRSSDNCYILVSAGPLEEEPTKESENSSSVAPTVPTVDAASTISEESDVNSETGDEAEVRPLELDDQTHKEPSRRVKKNHPVDQVIGPVEEGIQTRGFSDADWAGDADDRKSTTGGCFYLGNNLVSWYSKKRNSISLSTAESEYIAAGSCCAQLLWMKQMVCDYGISQDLLHIYCDNVSAINISKNPVQHSRTKHIEIRYHFIRNLVEEGTVSLEYVTTEKQLADIFTKPLDAQRVSPPPSSLVTPPSPPVTPPSPFNYSPPSSPLPHSPAAQSSPPPVEPTSPPSSTTAPASPPPPPSSSVNKGKGPATTPPPLRRSRRRATHSASSSAQPTTSDDSAPDPVVPISAVDAFNSRFFLRANQIRWRLKKLDYFTALAQKGGDYSSGGVDNEASTEPHTGGADAAAGTTTDPTVVAPTASKSLLGLTLFFF
ncbi:PREDICTED: uncharacterized protein LOC105961635 [Erythranthe guttata]|uniref:uncharacterized protein LOC105961635 n=1 Tax=Erythranthe guttata TaxID=4155 RepID=UPI00064D9397|nr:PREDICTED: uncharacterized protein LOC105961635 [Erythranthe guttata]|eukprot:XP_012841324.1 PREDICTED: uncharacterized protein LOC105961635 [Erythranthe guttata]